MTRFRTMFQSYFYRTIDFEQLTDQSYVGSNRFFHAESESETGFSISHTVFAGLPYCHVPYFDLATLETLIGPYLGHHSSNFQISFCKINYFFMMNPIQTVKCPYLSRILQGCQIPHFHLATLERLVRLYLSHH